MAYMQAATCQRCGKPFTQTISSGQIPWETVCPNCLSKEADAKRKAHFDALDKLTVEERIRKIEEWIYDYKPPVNIRDMTF